MQKLRAENVEKKKNILPHTAKTVADENASLKEPLDAIGCQPAQEESIAPQPHVISAETGVRIARDNSWRETHTGGSSNNGQTVFGKSYVFLSAATKLRFGCCVSSNSYFCFYV